MFFQLSVFCTYIKGKYSGLLHLGSVSSVMYIHLMRHTNRIVSGITISRVKYPRIYTSDNVKGLINFTSFDFFAAQFFQEFSFFQNVLHIFKIYLLHRSAFQKIKNNSSGFHRICLTEKDADPQCLI